MLLSYKAKKNKVVYLLSSSHKTITVDYGEQKKPQAILDYIATKGGVDTADEMLRTYSTKAASRRWPLAAFFNLVDITVLNTYIICADISITTCSRRDFLIKLGESLCSAERSRRQKAPHILRLKQIRQGEDEDLPHSKRTKCRMCQSNKTKVMCANCLLFVCGKCYAPVCHTCLNAEDFEKGVN